MEKKGMGKRGVTRPAALQESGQHEEHGDGKGRMDMGPPGSEQRLQMLAMHHRQTLWIYWSIILLGFWLLVSPATFGYDTGTVIPAGNRPVWLDLETRAAVLVWSDIVSGLLLIVFGWRALMPNRPLSLWAACGVGVWLNAAPLLFWAPSAAVYLNDTIVGTLVIALTILIPGMPNMMNYMEMGPETPPGWSYNPSSWPQRSILIGLGLAGWLVSRYLTAFQLGYIPAAWDPFFGQSSREVLTSDMSRTWPISDAGLGALSYTLEFLMGWMGGTSRWRTMPWMVVFFGILVIPLGLVHIFLVASQPVVVGHWCTLCLVAAAIMLPMIPLTVDEVVAMLQFMRRRKLQGASLWRVFWMGDTDEGGGPDERTPAMADLSKRTQPVVTAMFYGMSFPWHLIFTAALGVWLMASPGILGSTGRVADIEQIGGALVLTLSVIAMGEVIRAVRLGNVLVGLLVAASPLIFAGAAAGSLIADILVGLAIVLASLPRGRITESYGTWDSYVR